MTELTNWLQRHGSLLQGIVFNKARQSHAFLHQPARMLAKQFDLPLTDAQGIVKACPDCQKEGLGLGCGVNRRGLLPLQLWQMDFTHVMWFGAKRSVHVCIDTYPAAMWATARTGEKALHIE